MHPKPAWPLDTLNGIPLYAGPGPCTLNRRGRSTPYIAYPCTQSQVAVHPKPAGPRNTLNGIPLYAGSGAVHPKPAAPRSTLNGIPVYAVSGGQRGQVPLKGAPVPKHVFLGSSTQSTHSDDTFVFKLREFLRLLKVASVLRGIASGMKEHVHKH